MFVCCECCVLSGRSLCDGLIIRPEDSYRLCYVDECDLETSWMRRPWPTGGCRAKLKKNNNARYVLNAQDQFQTQRKPPKRCYLLQISSSLWRNSVQNFDKCDIACEKTGSGILYKDICILYADRARDYELWHRCILCSGSSPAECSIPVTHRPVHLWLLLLTELLHSGGSRPNAEKTWSAIFKYRN
jgi:hypothetical protein